LEIILEMNWKSKQKIQTSYNECSELVALFTTIGNSTK